MKKHDTLPEPDSQYPYGWPVLIFLKKRIFLKKGLLSHQKCISCHSQGEQPIQKSQNKKGGQHYEDR
ncbi:hypothetical protein AALB53_19900 [Lachnospiraceae bacterium 47-T17]